jgi:phage tail protein X
MGVLMESFNYVTKQNDRWDLISVIHYGNLNPLKELMNANPSVALGMIIPQNTNIIIPIIDNSSDYILTKNLPPWK